MGWVLAVILMLFAIGYRILVRRSEEK